MFFSSISCKFLPCELFRQVKSNCPTNWVLIFEGRSTWSIFYVSVACVIGLSYSDMFVHLQSRILLCKLVLKRTCFVRLDLLVFGIIRNAGALVVISLTLWLTYKSINTDRWKLLEHWTIAYRNCHCNLTNTSLNKV